MGNIEEENCEAVEASGLSLLLGLRLLGLCWPWCTLLVERRLMAKGDEVKKRRPFEDTLRTLEFWKRASGVYAAYKGAQTRAAFLSKAGGWDAERLKEDFWKPHHTWCVSASLARKRHTGQMCLRSRLPSDSV